MNAVSNEQITSNATPSAESKAKLQSRSNSFASFAPSHGVFIPNSYLDKLNVSPTSLRRGNSGIPNL
jgi:hypothetical protein